MAKAQMRKFPGTNLLEGPPRMIGRIPGTGTRHRLGSFPFLFTLSSPQPYNNDGVT